MIATLVLALAFLQSTFAWQLSGLNIPGFNGVTAGALTTMLFGVAGWVLVLALPPTSRRFLTFTWPWLVLLAFTLLSLLWFPPQPTSLQNILAISSFIASLYIAAKLTRRSEARASLLISVAAGSSVILGVLYLISLRTGGLASWDFMPPRVFGLVAIYGVSLFAALARYRNRAWGIAALILTLLVAASLSRTAMFSCLIILALAFMPSRGAKGWVRLVVAAAVVLGGLYVAAYNIPALHERFFSGDTSLSAGGVAVNASGRTGIWRVVIETWQLSPWIGRGAGSAFIDVDNALPLDGIGGHPHNDYLLILHDYGVLGEAFFVLAWLLLVYSLHLAWREAVRGRRTLDATLALAGFLTVAGLLVAMSTDNPLTYPFVMVPSFFIVGGALGRWAAASRVSSARRADPRPNISTPIRVRA